MKKKIFSMFMVLLVSVMSTGFAESDGTNMDTSAFREAAEEYAAESERFKEKGMNDIALMYDRLSKIKLQAEYLTLHGKAHEMNWNEFKGVEAELQKQLAAEQKK
jgi:hypothetical protein